MKTTILKNKYLLIGMAIMSFWAFLILGCFKTTNSKLPEPNSDQILNQIVKDSNYSIYKENLNLLATKSMSSMVAYNLDEQNFVTLFQESIDNNIDSKIKISNYLGFLNSNEFWNIRAKLNSSLSNLIKKYDFKKISKIQWYNLIKSSNTLALYQAQPRIKPFMLNPDICIEQYRDCIDDSKAQYAVECLGCVGWGALGWTVVGGVLFVGCEGLSYYHFTTMKRKCESSYKSCK
jgi:hypothetical protein